MRRVLLVDDNVAFTDNLAEIIGDAGLAEAVVADSGERALSLVRESQFDVLVTDMRMPGMDGAQLIHHVRAIDPSLPIVVVTAFSGTDQLGNVAREGVLSVFAKPPPIAELLRAIAAARRGVVLVIGDASSSLARDVAETLRVRGVACVTVLRLEHVVLLSDDSVIALIDVRVDDDHRLGPLAARFPKAPVIDATDAQQAVTAIEAVCGALGG